MWVGGCVGLVVGEGREEKAKGADPWGVVKVAVPRQSYYAHAASRL